MRDKSLTLSMRNFLMRNRQRLLPLLLVLVSNQQICNYISFLPTAHAQTNTTLIDSIDRRLRQDTVHEILSYYLQRV